MLQPVEEELVPPHGHIEHLPVAPIYGHRVWRLRGPPRSGDRQQANRTLNPLRNERRRCKEKEEVN